MRDLIDAEREALEGWLPSEARVLAVVRGAPAPEGHPVWFATTAGTMLAMFCEVEPQRVRARVSWILPYQMQRLDVLSESGQSLLRLITTTKRHLLRGVPEAEATRFAEQVRTAMHAARHERAVSASAGPRLQSVS